MRIKRFNEDVKNDKNEMDQHIQYVFDSIKDYTLNPTLIFNYIADDGEVVYDLSELSNTNFEHIDHVYKSYEISFVIPTCTSKKEEFLPLKELINEYYEINKLMETLESGLTLYDNLESQYYVTNDRINNVLTDIIIIIVKDTDNVIDVSRIDNKGINNDIRR